MEMDMSNSQKMRDSRRYSDSHQLADEITFQELLSAFYQQKWFVFFVTFSCFIVTFCYTLTISPLYQTSALIQIDNQQKGLGSSLEGITEQGSVQQSSPIDIEKALMQSRYILGPMIEAYHLNITAKPRYFPVIGVFFARINSPLSFLFPSSYVRNGESISVDQFEVPPDMQEQIFLIEARGHQQYNVYMPDGRLLLTGMVGQMITLQQDPRYKIHVNYLRAHPGAEFELIDQSIATIADTFARHLLMIDIGSRKLSDGTQISLAPTGVLSIALSGGDENKISAMLNTIIQDTIEKNLEQKNTAAQQVLNFFHQQLPIAAADLNQAETSINQYRSKTKMLSLSSEGTFLLQQVSSLQQSLEQLKLRKAELLLSYTEQHPLLQAITEQESQLTAQLKVLDNKVGMLPASEQKLVGFERTIRVKEQMYLALLTNIQQAEVTQAGIVSDIRVLSWATYPTEMPSKKMIIMLGGIIGGFILSIMVIIIRLLFVRKMDEPDYVEEQLGISIYAIIPHSLAQEKIAKEIRRKIPGINSFVLAKRHPKDLAMEGLRSLRTTLQFAVAEAKNNILAITGASPSIGKSFVTTNLAFLLADTGKTVLLIDSDMRKGKIHEQLSKRHAPGLADLLEGQLSFDEVKQPISDKIDFLSTGKYPSNPSELLMKDHIEKFLSEVSARYDIVLIDTPPVLAVTDSVILMQYAGTNLMVIGSGQETLSEISHAVKRIKKNQVTIHGLVFNNVAKQKHAYGYYYYYDYGSKQK
ncbi:MAG: hypothetical protein A2X77_04825 [Gammaproteobacteria bacterium GWE2_42_36]|nr:MAG: hypothetical protein A2X77_04825 [Gammaproteobacteria bacterium GWE2_42_36]